jgi:muramoyltetrapeptide carboxypeptidase
VVAVVAPAGPVRRERLAAGIEVLESWGLRTRAGAHVLGRHPRLAHLAGTDADRAADLNAGWCAPDVAAVWAARGGSGSHRLVDLLDWPAMTQVPPRLLVGFSDVTALHEAVAQRLGLVSLHGPVVTSLGESQQPARDQVRRMLFEPDTVAELASGLRRVSGGTADGVLVGGNLRVVTASLGTRVSRPAAGGIVVLEDVGEQAYRVDGMLTQLLRAGWFGGVRGVVAGAFTGSGTTDVDAVVAERLGALGVPVVTGAPIGHVPDNRPVPLGVPARLDADAGTLVLTRPALT